LDILEEKLAPITKLHNSQVFATKSSDQIGDENIKENLESLAEEANLLCEKLEIKYRVQIEATEPDQVAQTSDIVVNVILPNGERSCVNWEPLIFLERLQLLRSLYNALPKNQNKQQIVPLHDGEPTVDHNEQSNILDDDTETTCDIRNSEAAVKEPLQTETLDIDDNIVVHGDELVNVSSSSSIQEIDEFEEGNISDPDLSTIAGDAQAQQARRVEVDPFFEVRSNAIRLMGHARVFLGYGIEFKNQVVDLKVMSRSIAVYDSVGKNVASMNAELRFEHATTTDDGNFSILSPRNMSSKLRIQVLLKDIHFISGVFSEGMYATYRIWNQNKTWYVDALIL